MNKYLLRLKFRNPRGWLLLCFLSVLVNASPPPPLVSQSELKLMGYDSLDIRSVNQSEWERSQFGTAEVTEQRIKAKNPMEGESGLYPRFTLIREVHTDPAQAAKRLSRVTDHDPALITKKQPNLILRKGFLVKNEVWMVTTDAVIFSRAVLDSVFNQLKQSQLKKDL